MTTNTCMDECLITDIPIELQKYHELYVTVTYLVSQPDLKLVHFHTGDGFDNGGDRIDLLGSAYTNHILELLNRHAEKNSLIDRIETIKLTKSRNGLKFVKQ